jgi:hypothetical protein
MPAVYFFKSSARRGIKEFRALFPSAAATRTPLGQTLARDPQAEARIERAFGRGAISKVMAGRDVAEVGPALGHGNEGVAYPALSRRGLGVMKVHDPTAPLYSPDVIQGKRQFVGATNPNLAKIHYEMAPRRIRVGPTSHVNAPTFMHEFVRGRDLNIKNPLDRMKATNLETSVRNYSSRGYSPIDVSPHNIKITPGGRVVAVDYMGAPTSSLVPGGRRSGALATAFKEGINDPYFSRMNTMMSPVARPTSLEDTSRLTGRDYGQFVLRGGQRATPATSSPFRLGATEPLPRSYAPTQLQRKT